LEERREAECGCGSVRFLFLSLPSTSSFFPPIFRAFSFPSFLIADSLHSSPFSFFTSHPFPFPILSPPFSPLSRPPSTSISHLYRSMAPPRLPQHRRRSSTAIDALSGVLGRTGGGTGRISLSGRGGAIGSVEALYVVKTLLSLCSSCLQLHESTTLRFLSDRVIAFSLLLLTSFLTLQIRRRTKGRSTALHTASTSE
jgi:hypothetical protein